MILGSVPHPHVIQCKFETKLEVWGWWVCIYVYGIKKDCLSPKDGEKKHGSGGGEQ